MRIILNLKIKSHKDYFTKTKVTKIVITSDS